MTKTKNLKKLLAFTMILLSISIIITPVNAITEYIDYDSGLVTGRFEGYPGVSSGYSANVRDVNVRLVFPAVEEWKQVKAIVYAMEYDEWIAGKPWWSTRDNTHTSDVPVVYKISGNIVSSGIIQFVRHVDEGVLIGGTLLFTFDTPLDTDLIGSRHIECVYTRSDLNFRYMHPTNPYVYTFNEGNCPYLVMAGADPSVYNYYGQSYSSGIGYKYSVFTSEFTYNYNDESKDNINFFFDRKEQASRIDMVGVSGAIQISDLSSENIQLDLLYDIPYTLNITNPVYSGNGLGEFFEYIIPEDVIGADIATLSWYAYNKEATGTEVIGVNYNLQIRNETDLSWSIQESGYNPSYSDLEIPNNAYYNMSLTAPDYEPLDDYTFSVIGDRTLSFGLYPEYGANFSVNFQVRGFSGERIEAAKITLNDIIKYTHYNGMVGFGDISGYIEYEISKTGYVSISGNKTITENTEMYIIMKTEAQALEEDDITPTPTIPPDITQPTNLLESIQFAFQKMFGLSSSVEDMETADLFMGLGIIFAGACLIAVITKDALGAVVGGLIGFIMSLALGFIPLWVLFVGFASFAIYIILTKTGGSE